MIEIFLFSLVIILLVGCGFYSLLKDRLKSGGGSAAITLGATDHMLTQDKRRAAQEIVQELSGEIRHLSETDDGENDKEDGKRQPS
ncbi:MAG: hypothetical protein ACO36I_12675 [Candidatus Latescibacterota bacterium]|jgi:hypothetical protein